MTAVYPLGYYSIIKLRKGLEMRDIKAGKVIKSDINDKAEKFTWVPMTEEQARESVKRLDWKLQKEMLKKEKDYALNNVCTRYYQKLLLIL